jgi:uncharacterized protein (DUF2132 family)
LNTDLNTDLAINIRLLKRVIVKTTNQSKPPEQPNNPLHGLTLEKIVTSLVEHYGWEELGRRINIRCFNSDPSIKSSLKFLRKTPWARDKVEQLYLSTNDRV